MLLQRKRKVFLCQDFVQWYLLYYFKINICIQKEECLFHGSPDGLLLPCVVGVFTWDFFRSSLTIGDGAQRFKLNLHQRMVRATLLQVQFTLMRECMNFAGKHTFLSSSCVYLRASGGGYTPIFPKCYQWGFVLILKTMAIEQQKAGQYRIQRVSMK